MTMGLMKRFYGSSGSGRSFMAVEWFFDSPKVTRAVDKASRRVLSKFGAFVRRTARQSIRKPRKVAIGKLTDIQRAHYRKTKERPFASSEPGKPPRNLTGKLKDNILFWYDVHEQSVTIGPAAFNAGIDGMGSLEQGGIILTSGFNRKLVRIEARPFMRPALARELPKLDAMWRDSVRSSV
jgi:hypothetical protein